MQTQHPDQNNPSNPLAKVAAFDIDRIYGENNSKDILVRATLNFKKSNDMRGKAITDDGIEVDVNFSLAIKKATLQIDFVCEELDSSQKIIDIKNVAFASALAAVGKISQIYNVTGQNGLNFAAEASVGGDTSIALPTSTAGIKVSSKMAYGYKVDANTKYSLSYECSNIKVTHGGNMIHWEIHPKQVLSKPVKLPDFDHLDGDIFLATGESEINCACVVRKREILSGRNFTIDGSVRTSVQDLIIDDVRFVDCLGNNVEVGKIKPDFHETLADYAVSMVNKDRLKLNLVKSIIRKHLKNQGMEINGSSIEICRAKS